MKFRITGITRVTTTIIPTWKVGGGRENLEHPLLTWGEGEGEGEYVGEGS